MAFSGCASTRERAAHDIWEAESRRVAELADSTEVLLDGMATLQDYVGLALKRNRGVIAARSEWKAALEEVPQARALPDPILRYGYYIQAVETRVGPQRHRLGASQAFPWFGTLGLRADAALAGAEAARQRYQNFLETTVLRVTKVYAEYYVLGAALRITQENTELLRGWERILRARYAAAAANYSDLLKVQVDLGELEDRIVTLEEQRNPVAARLNALLDLPQDLLLPWPVSLPMTPPLQSREKLGELLRERNPEIQALEALTEREQSRIDLTSKDYFPNFMIGLDWIQTDPRGVPDLEEDGKDPLIFQVGINVPLWLGKKSAAHRQAQARRIAVQEKKQDRTNLLQSELADLVFRHDDAERKVSLYRDSLVPKAGQSLDAAYSAFEAGQADFLDVLDAQRALLEFSLSLERARADLIQTRTGVDALLGQATEWQEAR